MVDFPQEWVTFDNFDYPVMVLMVLWVACSQRHLDYLSFQSFDFERAW